MAHEIAKLLLEHSGVLERSKVIQQALNLGMPLHEIEEYLDWVDSMKSGKPDSKPDSPPNNDKPGK
jgi:DNA-binding transcriptional MerR regulator